MTFRSSVFVFMVAMAGLASCKNNEADIKTVKYTGLNIINASKDTLNFYLNGTRLNGLSSIYPNGALGLYAVPSGAQNFQFKKAGRSDVLFSLPLNLSVQSFNSVFIAAPSADKIIKTTDTIPKVSSTVDTIAVRYVNASPDAGTLNVSVGDTVSFRGYAFKTVSTYRISGSGQKRVRVYLDGIATPRLDTIMTFQPQTDYTLFTKGLLSGKGTAAFNVGLIINQTSYQN